MYEEMSTLQGILKLILYLIVNNSLLLPQEFALVDWQPTRVIEGLLPIQCCKPWEFYCSEVMIVGWSTF